MDYRSIALVPTASALEYGPGVFMKKTGHRSPSPVYIMKKVDDWRRDVIEI